MGDHPLNLERNAHGGLVLRYKGRIHEDIVPVRGFPISAPERGLALVAADGTELVWLDRLEELPEPARRLLEEELDRREFVPEIRKIRAVSRFATPSRWDVDTDRGPTVLNLRAEEDIRRLSGNTLLIADNHGVHFLLRDLRKLDAGSRRLLDHFL